MTESENKLKKYYKKYFSKSLDKNQSSYTAFELEFYAVKKSIEHFQYYLHIRLRLITCYSALK